MQVQGLLKEKGLKTIGEIRLDTFLEYRNWRVTKGWQEIRSTRTEGPPKDSTVKRDFTHLKDWFANFLLSAHGEVHMSRIPLRESAPHSRQTSPSNSR